MNNYDEQLEKKVMILINPPHCQNFPGKKAQKVYPDDGLL
jgi:hypothetical protein